MNKGMVLVAAKLVMAGSFAVSGMIGLAGHSQAQPTETVTVDGVDYPVCSEEDCSDQPGQIGVWQSPRTGEYWLSLGERSYHITR